MGLIVVFILIFLFQKCCPDVLKKNSIADQSNPPNVRLTSIPIDIVGSLVNGLTSWTQRWTSERTPVAYMSIKNDIHLFVFVVSVLKLQIVESNHCMGLSSFVFFLCFVFL